MTANVLAEGGSLTPRFAFDAQLNDVNPSTPYRGTLWRWLVDAG